MKHSSRLRIPRFLLQALIDEFMLLGLVSHYGLGRRDVPNNPSPFWKFLDMPISRLLKSRLSHSGRCEVVLAHGVGLALVKYRIKVSREKSSIVAFSLTVIE